MGQQNVLRGSGKEVRNATFVLPSWWKSRSYIYVDEHRKEEAKEEVRKILKQLNDLRISGRDYRFDLIVELYRICTVRFPLEWVEGQLYFMLCRIHALLPRLPETTWLQASIAMLSTAPYV